MTTINGGAGADKIIVGGDVTKQVVANSTKGASSVSDVSVVSGDPAYNGIFVDGIPITVAGAGASIISQPPQSVVHVGDAASITSFLVSAPSALLAGKVAYVDISPALPSAEWAALGAAALQVSVDGGQTWSATGQLKFVGGLTGPQTVLLRAAAVPANDTYSRDETIIVASRVVSADQPELNALNLPTVKVTVKTSASGLIIDQSLAPTTILGGASAATQTSYSYALSLNHALTGNQTVTVNLLDANAAADGIVLRQNGQIVTSVTFNASNWNKPQQITATSTLTGVHDQIPVVIAQTINGVDVGDVSLAVAATNTPGVLLLTPQGACGGVLHSELQLSGGADQGADRARHRQPARRRSDHRFFERAGLRRRASDADLHVRQLEHTGDGDAEGQPQLHAAGCWRAECGLCELPDLPQSTAQSRPDQRAARHRRRDRGGAAVFGRRAGSAL